MRYNILIAKHLSLVKIEKERLMLWQHTQKKELRLKKKSQSLM
jgi:hypothetical protein